MNWCERYNFRNLAFNLSNKKYKGKIMSLNINVNTATNLSGMMIGVKHVICEQKDSSSSKSIQLWLEKNIFNGKKQVFLRSIAHKAGEIQKTATLSSHKADSRGIKTILASTESHSFDSMYDLIVA